MTIHKAFIIAGGNEQARKTVRSQLSREEAMLMYADYPSADGQKIGLIFSDAHRDFDDMNFEKVEGLAGTEKLGANFHTSTFGKEKCFGVIELS